MDTDRKWTEGKICDVKTIWTKGSPAVCLNPTPTFQHCKDDDGNNSNSSSSSSNNSNRKSSNNKTTTATAAAATTITTG